MVIHFNANAADAIVAANYLESTLCKPTGRVFAVPVTRDSAQVTCPKCQRLLAKGAR